MFINFRLVPVLTLLIALSQVTTVKSEPSTPIQTLMDRPMSLLDWGMYRLQKILTERESWLEDWKVKPDSVNVYYDWESDEIFITINRLFKRPNSYEEAETDCKEDFNQVDAFVYIKEGKDTLSDFSFVGNQFTHNGWEDSKVKDAAAKISSRFVVMINLGTYSCKRELMNTSISVVKNY